jgi:uncharacterized protein
MAFKNFTQKHPAATYFITAFTISWLGAFILVAPKLINKQPIPKMDGILMFPIMLIGPVAAAIILTASVEGSTGIRNLFSKMGKWKVPVKWYVTALIIPPCLIMITLLILKNFVSPVFKPNLFYLGFLFGIPAGFFEEIGWTGYAFPKLRLQQNFIKASVILGFFWGLWHFPVIDFLGAASPDGTYLLPFFISFIAILTAIRVLIAWIYSNTKSILLAQFMHAVSTGCLAMLGPSGLSPEQETSWYALYAIMLWITILLIFRVKYKKNKSILNPNQ